MTSGETAISEKVLDEMMKQKNGGSLTSHIPAHKSTALAAPFRA